jgi:hypothetical protein
MRTTELVLDEDDYDRVLDGEEVKPRVTVNPMELFFNALENNAESQEILAEVIAVGIVAAGEYGGKLFDESGDFLPEVWRVVKEMGFGLEVRRQVRHIRRTEME